MDSRWQCRVWLPRPFIFPLAISAQNYSSPDAQCHKSEARLSNLTVWGLDHSQSSLSVLPMLTHTVLLQCVLCSHTQVLPLSVLPVLTLSPPSQCVLYAHTHSSLSMCALCSYTQSSPPRCAPCVHTLSPPPQCAPCVHTHSPPPQCAPCVHTLIPPPQCAPCTHSVLPLNVRCAHTTPLTFQLMLHRSCPRSQSDQRCGGHRRP